MSSSGTERSGDTVEVAMPQMGVSVAEGTILEWRKRPGDWVAADETVADVSTDKVDVEIPAPVAGRLAEILVEAGETVPVGTALATVDTAARPGEAHPEERERPAPERAAAGAAAVTRESGARTEKAGAPGAPNGEPDRSRLYSPVVRRIADEHDVDLTRVEGTGVGGRIRKRDLLDYLDHREAESAPAEPALHTDSPYRPERPEPGAPAEPRESAPPSPGEGADRREPMSPMRKAIARHMVESRHTAAHCTTIVEVDFSRVAARRAELRETMKRRGVSLTYLAFVARATVEALERHPKLNASIDEEAGEFVLHDDVNLGIAVALEDGLIAPVIRQAQRLSLEGLASEIADLAERARAGRLAPDEIEGGTFTITNPGQFGAVLATPIIHQPQVAILDLEAIVKRPVAVEGPEGDAIAIRPMSWLCMSWDHRALDGADAARFLSDVK